jgi:hypothetical protein
LIIIAISSEELIDHCVEPREILFKIVIKAQAGKLAQIEVQILQMFNLTT